VRGAVWWQGHFFHLQQDVPLDRWQRSGFVSTAPPPPTTTTTTTVLLLLLLLLLPLPQSACNKLGHSQPTRMIGFSKVSQARNNPKIKLLDLKQVKAYLETPSTSWDDAARTPLVIDNFSAGFRGNGLAAKALASELAIAAGTSLPAIQSAPTGVPMPAGDGDGLIDAESVLGKVPCPKCDEPMPVLPGNEAFCAGCKQDFDLGPGGVWEPSSISQDSGVSPFEIKQETTEEKQREPKTDTEQHSAEQQQIPGKSMRGSAPDKITPSKAKTAATPVTVSKLAPANKKAAAPTAKAAAAAKLTMPKAQTRVSTRLAAKKKLLHA